MTHKEKTVVLYDSNESASIKTVTGWVSRIGRFWGDDEHMARFDGSTHRKCNGCGEMVSHQSYCRVCSDKRSEDMFLAMPRVKWDGTSMIYSDSRDRYYSDPAEALEEVLEEGETLEDLRLIICVPEYLHQLDSETWVDDLPEDGELPSEVDAALDALNMAIREAGPSCWRPGKVALDLTTIG